MHKLSKFRFVSILTLIFFIGSTVIPPNTVAHNEWWGNGGQPLGNPTDLPGDPKDTQLSQDPIRNKCEVDDPVYLHSGEFYYECVDLFIPGRGLDVEIKHTYRGGRQFNGPFGYGWFMNYYYRLKPLSGGGVMITSGEGRYDEYKFQNGKYVAPEGFYETLVANGNGTWTLTKADTTEYHFDVNGNLSAIKDRHGNQITFAYKSPGLIPVIGVSRFGQPTGPARYNIMFDYQLEKITDTVGRVINFTYNKDGRLEKIVDYAGRTVSFGYDATTDDLLTITLPSSKQYPSGLTKTFTYVGEHKLKTITDAKSQTFVTNHYNSSGRVFKQDLGSGTVQFFYDSPTKTRVIDRKGFTTQYTFNAKGNPIKIERSTKGLRQGEPSSYVTTYTYNANMEKTSETFPKGNGIKYKYDETNANVRARGNLLEIRRKADMSKPDNDTADIVTVFTYEPRTNQIKTVKDPRGNVTISSFDYEMPVGHILHGNKADLVGLQYPAVAGGVPIALFLHNQHGQLAFSMDPNFIVTQYNYHATTGYLKEVIEDIFGLAVKTASFTYDQYGNLDKVTDAENRVTDFDYNTLNWLIQEKDPLGYITKFHYDKNGNLEKTEAQANTAATIWQTTSFTYDNLNNLKTITDPLKRITTFNYDKNENVASIVDAETKTTDYIFDERNLLFKVTDANVPRGTTQYDYDINGNIAKISDAKSNPTGYEYDLFDRQEKVTYANNKFSKFEYDKNSNLLKHHTPSLDKLTYVYDPLNRLTQKQYSNNNSLNTTYQYDLGSRLKWATNAQQMVGFLYDNLNRIWVTGQIYGGNLFSILIYGYDKVGNRTSILYPSNKTVSYTYDKNDRMDLVKVNNTIVADYNYDPLDRRELVTYPLASTNKTTANYQFDLANQLKQIKNQFSGTANNLLSQFDYATYDKVGNRKTMDVKRGTTPVKNHTYGYNNIYELTSVAGAQTHTYAIDNVGNRTTVDKVNYTPNNLNQYSRVGTTNFIYDNNANLTNDGTNTYTYDIENRLETVKKTGTVASYEYDGLNRRGSKTVNGTKTYFIYDGDHVLEERDANGGLIADYVHGDAIDEVLTMSRGSNTYYYHYDGLGSINDISDSNGRVVEWYEYDVYGQPTIRDASNKIITSSAIGNPYYFTGRRLDAESGIYYYRARMYDSAIGRFLQRDPLGYIDGMNLYSYVKNNPTNFKDPSGRQIGGAMSPPISPPILPPMTPIQPPIQPLQSQCSFNRDITVEDECHLIDNGPTVCIYECEVTGKFITRPPEVPGEKSTCAPMIKLIDNLF